MDYNYYHRLLRNGADLSVLDNAESLTHDQVVLLLQDYIKYETLIVGDPARRIAAKYMEEAKISDQRVYQAQQFLSNIT